MPDDTTQTPPADDTVTDAPEQVTTPEGEGDEPQDGQTFDADYVRKLRAEAAGHRSSKKELAEQLEQAQQELARLRDERFLRLVHDATATTLADPQDLLTFVDRDALLDEDGQPDREAIEQAARDLVKAKPHLAPRRFAGSADQGAHGTPRHEGFDSVLRRLAGGQE